MKVFGVNSKVLYRTCLSHMGEWRFCLGPVPNWFCMSYSQEGEPLERMDLVDICGPKFVNSTEGCSLKDIPHWQWCSGVPFDTS